MIGGDVEPGVDIRIVVIPDDVVLGGKINFPVSKDFDMVAGDRLKDCFIRASAEEEVGGAPPPSRWWAWCDPVISGGGTGTPADWARYDTSLRNSSRAFV